MARNQNMKVYYGTNFWGHPKGAEELNKIQLNKEFIWGELSGFIPAVYVGEQGIAIDFCIRISNEEIRAFYKKWKPRLLEGMSEEEQRQIMEENPLDMDFSLKIFANGEELENDFGCGASYSSVIDEEFPTKDAKVEEQLMQEYECDREFGWYFQRHICKWERPEVLKSLDIQLTASNKEYACNPIEFCMENKESVYELVHPANGQVFQLQVHDFEQGEIDPEILKGFHKKNVEYPAHYLTMYYTLTPDLSAENFQMQNVDPGDKPRRLKENPDGTVTVTGHVDSAASIFLAGRSKDREKKVAMSSLYFHPIESAGWRPVFMEKEREDMVLHVEV